MNTGLRLTRVWHVYSSMTGRFCVSADSVCSSAKSAKVFVVLMVRYDHHDVMTHWLFESFIGM